MGKEIAKIFYKGKDIDELSAEELRQALRDASEIIFRQEKNFAELIGVAEFSYSIKE
jgi:hypothetical protein